MLHGFARVAAVRTDVAGRRGVDVVKLAALVVDEARDWPPVAVAHLTPPPPPLFENP